jgi:LDH2 family malate/lactate/ureidoglycolate dehydrogenase
MHVSHHNLFECAFELLVSAGEGKEDARIAADNLVKADARGITTHGTYLLNLIYKRKEAGIINLPTKLSVQVDQGAIALIDGGNGLGMLAGHLAEEIAVEKAKNFGISLILIRNTNTVGSLANYTESIAKKGLIALMSCNAAPSMAPWGGAEPFTGTNPLAVGIYTGRDLVFNADMATSIVARGKIRQAARQGKEIPADWSLDENGNLTTDPIAALKGTVLPMAGPKGSAIALAIDILSGMVAGSHYAPNLLSFHTTDGPTGVGASLIVVDISKFIPLDEFQRKMDDYVLNLKGMKKASFAKEIFLPGEIEFNREQESNQSGIFLDDQAVQNLNNLLEKVGSKQRLRSS